MKMNLALILLLAAAPAAAQSAASDFDALTRAGFSAVTASAGSAPSAVPAAARKFVPAGGVYLHSWAQGRLFHCSASGCFLLRASGAAIVVSSGQGGVYFTGSDGTGYCDAGGCTLLLPGQRVTFPLAAGPRGDIWAANRAGGWHCTPAKCEAAFSGAMQGSSNYLGGVYKAGGAFASSGADGTFWCDAGRCRKIGVGELLFVEDRCAGAPPADASFGFRGREIFRCSASGCVRLAVDDDAVDNYNDCAFDAQGRLLLPRRGSDRRLTGDSLACDGRACRPDAAPAPMRQEYTGLTDDGWLRGDDGARYRIEARWTLPAPAAGAPTVAPPTLMREGACGRSTLTADAACFQWLTATGDDDEGGPAWSSTCRLIK